MIFNIKLLYNIPDEQKDLAKFVLLAIAEDIRMDNPLINKRTSVLDNNASVFWKDTILMDVQDVLAILHENKVIRRDLQYSPERENVRWILERPLYVYSIEDGLTDEFINKLRSYFRRDYCGVDRGSSPKQVKEHLRNFLEKNKVELSELEPAFKHYVDTRKAEMGSQYIATILNFINHNRNEEFSGKDLQEYLSLKQKKARNYFA